jgi:hypothetical protein
MELVEPIQQGDALMTSMQTRWDLNELFGGYDSPELEAAFDKVEEMVTSFEGARGKLRADIAPEAFLRSWSGAEQIAGSQKQAVRLRRAVLCGRYTGPGGADAAGAWTCSPPG